MCFTLGWAEQLIIWLIIICGVVAFIRAILPLLAGFIPFPIVFTLIQIVLWVVVAIAVVRVIFGLLACLSGGPMHFLP